MRGSMPEMSETTEQQQQYEAETAGCPVEMSEGRRCGRPIHSVRAEFDKRPVCLMHSRDPDKEDDAFQKEFERILKAEGEGTADFTGFVFPRAGYAGREFTAQCVFFQTTFTQQADFTGATFTEKADFTLATFTQEASFNLAKFTQEAKFRVARFTQRADFSGAKLEKEADFRLAAFGTDAWFQETKFRNDDQGIGPIFSRARFEKPERVEFYQTYLGQALFHNCDVSKFVFSNVEWRKRKNGQRMVFEEVVSLEDEATEALKPPEGSADERDYGLIAELYQQLKKNFDERRDYWTAGDFHYGEMEMKRLSSRRHNRVLRWLKQTLGLTALYKHASEYGESYKRPAAWVGIFLLLFMLAYPDVGLQRNDVIPTPTSEIHYKNFFQFLEEHPKGAWAFFGHSLMTALSVMALQRELEYQPVYPWGRPLLTVFELVLSYILIALFLLAVRRQFRR